MILLTPHEILYYKFYLGTFEGKSKKVTSGISSVLSSEVRFSEDLRVVDLYHHLLRDKEMIDHIFRLITRGHKIEHYKTEFESGPDLSYETFHHLQFNWRTTIEDEGKVEQECHFSGVAPNSDGNRIDGVESAYGIDLTPLRDLANLPLKLNHNFLIEEYSKGLKIHLTATKEFTLIDIANSFLYNITWYGYPDDREKASAELLSRIEKAESEIERGKTYTMKKISKKFESRKN